MRREAGGPLGARLLTWHGPLPILRPPPPPTGAPPPPPPGCLLKPEKEEREVYTFPATPGLMQVKEESRAQGGVTTFVSHTTLSSPLGMQSSECNVLWQFPSSFS